MRGGASLAALGRVARPVLVVAGPTATGKTDVAQLAAERLGAAVVSADSMQVYRGMDIGTGKIALASRTVDYYGIDLVEPGEPFSAALYQSYARGVVDTLDNDGVPCVVCGGTGFYIRALVDDYRFPAGEQIGNTVRDHYAHVLEEAGAQAVWEALRERDPASAALVDPHDSKRVIRALELHEGGLSYARQREALKSIPQYLDAVFVGLSVQPDVLVKRINARVNGMMEQGLLAEVEELLTRGFRDALTASQAIGYKEMVAYLDGTCSLGEAVEAVKLATRRYAKRQRTWFRKEARMNWIDANEASAEVLCEQALEIYEQACVTRKV